MNYQSQFSVEVHYFNSNASLKNTEKVLLFFLFVFFFVFYQILFTFPPARTWQDAEPQKCNFNAPAIRKDFFFQIW